MSWEAMVRERQFKCTKCGNLISLPETDGEALLRCVCKAEYVYNSTVRIIPKLVIKRVGSSPLEFPLSDSVTIGRESGYGYIVIKSALDEAINENTFVRNPFVSREHARIEVKHENSLLSNDSSKGTIVRRKKCLIKDLGSKFGTSLNGTLLKSNEPQRLNHNDEIVLATNSDMPFAMTLKEM